MKQRHLMHVAELRHAMREARALAETYLRDRRPWYRPRLRLADMLAEAYMRGQADMAHRALTGHREKVVAPGKQVAYLGGVKSDNEVADKARAALEVKP